MSSGGETEPAAEASGHAPGQNAGGASWQDANARQEQHVVASPNPTVDDGKTPATTTTGTKKTEPTPVRPAQSSTDAPMKANGRKPKPKRAHAKRTAQ